MDYVDMGKRVRKQRQLIGLTQQELAERIRAMGAKATPCESVADGVDRAVAVEGKDGVACALGSLYMSGDVRACFQ